MKRNLLLTFILTTLANWANATMIEGHILGESLKWKNVITTHGESAPSAWVPISNLPTTPEWIPGNITVEINNIQLSADSGGIDITMPMQFVGMEYTTGNTPTLGTSVSGCSTSEQNGTLIHVHGATNCTLDTSLIYSVSQAPFIFARPIFHYDEATVVASFKDANAPEGVYRGSATVNYFYEYYYSGNPDIKTKHLASLPVYFKIEYEPAYITSIDLNGTGELQTRYDLSQDRVSGSTQFDGTISGYFTNGVTMSLANPSHEYHLTLDSHEIPYNVTCLGCDTNPKLVENGQGSTNQATIGGTGSNLNFFIQIDFSNQDLTSLETGRYMDSFVLIFEPGV